MTDPAISDITTFWLGPALDSPKAAGNRRDWRYRGGDIVDGEIHAFFADHVKRAVGEEFAVWEISPDGAFALILLLDQFTRNLYRNTNGAYSGDRRAYRVMQSAIDEGLDKALHPVSRIWLYHPLHHSEDIAQQDRGLDVLRNLKDESTEEWKAYVQRSIDGWTRHRDIVARFGRFPHRNHVLGRVSTPEETAYLKKHGQSFGQGPRRTQDV